MFGGSFSRQPAEVSKYEEADPLEAGKAHRAALYAVRFVSVANQRVGPRSGTRGTSGEPVARTEGEGLGFPLLF